MSEMEELAGAILAMVNDPNYHPVKPKVLARRLGLDTDGRRELRRTLKRLVKSGQLEYGSNHLVRPASADRAKRSSQADEITGRFLRAAGGYGFVRPLIRKSASVGREEDVYIPRSATLDASEGDTVRVRLRGRPKVNGKGPRGEILEILERRTHRFVGSFGWQDDQPVVRVDGNTFNAPILVGDPGAKSVQPEDKVVVEMIHFPTASEPGEGVIIEILGPRGKPGVDTLMIMREFDLEEEFPEDVLEDARSQAAAFDESIPETRRDLTDRVIVTIDPVDARDFDDAISLESLENGHWKLGVHIADVSHFVRRGSPLDREAKHRATSVYLPDRAIPMLPEIISNNLASLQPNRVRYALTVEMEMTREGVPVHTEVFRSAIKSSKRFAYEQIDDFLQNRQDWASRLTAPVFALLEQMYRLAMILRRRRLERGAMELHLPEVKIEMDRAGRVSGAHLVEHTESHQIIEEFMLAANEAVAQLLFDREITYLRRIHESPDPRKLRTLTRFVRDVGLECDSLESRYEIKRVIAEVAGQPEEKAVNLAILRSLQKAVYSPEEVGHYALNSDNYCHFTSPIRRYPDLVIHRMVNDLARGKTPGPPKHELIVLGDHCSDRERRAETAERELVKLKLLSYLESRIGWKLPAVITGVEEYGFFVQGVELPAEGLVPLESLTEDRYRYDADSHTLFGLREQSYFRLGDLVEVAVAHVDLDQREVDFTVVRKLHGRPLLPKTKRAAAQEKRAGKSGRGKPASGSRGKRKRPGKKRKGR